MGLLFWVCGWGCLLIVVVGLGFACHEFGFCSQWWGGLLHLLLMVD